MANAVRDLHQSGATPGSGTFTCSSCGGQLSLDALDSLPRCPHCRSTRFRRSSLFGPGHGGETLEYAHGPAVEQPDWLEKARVLAHDGRYLALRDKEIHLFVLTPGWTRIGRSATADARLDDPSVSRRHALLVSEPGEPLRILDDRSLNGIFLNGEPVEWSNVRDGDELRLGRYRLFLIEG